jgi:hypothetical protein
MRESDIVPSLPATEILQEKVKKIVSVKVDPESPESFMLRQSAAAGRTISTPAG